MALITTPKAGSVNSNTKSAVVSRSEVSVARPTASHARAEALKAKLRGGPAPTPKAQPVAPRPMGSTSRREEVAKLQKFNSPAPQTKPNPTQSRAVPENLESIAPPPSGLRQADSTIEAPAPAPEVTREPSNPQLDALARKERQVRKAQQELKAAQDSWKQDQAKYVPKERLTSETLKVLAEAGITPDKLVELQLNQAPQDPNQALINRIAQLEDQLKGIVDPEKGVLAQRDERDYNSAVEVIRTDAKLLVDSNPDFGTIKSEGKSEEVVDLITKVFDAEGIILDVEEAATLVEDKLVQRLTSQYDRLSKIDKIKKRLGQATETSPEATPPQQSANKKTVNTLTNAGAATHQLSPRDRAILRVQEAMEAAKRK